MCEAGHAPQRVFVFNLAHLLIEPFQILSICCDGVSPRPPVDVFGINKTPTHFCGFLWEDLREKRTSSDWKTNLPIVDLVMRSSIFSANARARSVVLSQLVPMGL